MASPYDEQGRRLYTKEFPATPEELQHAYGGVGGFDLTGYGLPPAEAARLRTSLPLFVRRPSTQTPAEAEARMSNVIEASDSRSAYDSDALDAEARALADSRMRRAANPVQLHIPPPESETPWERPKFTRTIIGGHDATGMSPSSRRQLADQYREAAANSEPEDTASSMQPPAPSEPSLSSAIGDKFSASGRDLSRMSPEGRARVLESEGRKNLANSMILERGMSRAANREGRMGSAPMWYQSPGQRAMTDLYNRQLGLQERVANASLGAGDREMQMRLELADRARGDRREDRMFALSQQHHAMARAARDQASQIRMSTDFRSNPRLQEQVRRLEQQASEDDYYSRQYASRAGGLSIAPPPGGVAESAGGSAGSPGGSAEGDAGDASQENALKMQDAYEKAVASGGGIDAFFGFLPPELWHDKAAHELAIERFGYPAYQDAQDKAEARRKYGTIIPGGRVRPSPYLPDDETFWSAYSRGPAQYLLTPGAALMGPAGLAPALGDFLRRMRGEGPEPAAPTAPPRSLSEQINEPPPEAVIQAIGNSRNSPVAENPGQAQLSDAIRRIREAKARGIIQ